jgi:hypothetical protein
MAKARSPEEKREEAQRAHQIRKRVLLGPTHPKFPSEKDRAWLAKYNARVAPSNRGRPLEGVPPPGPADKPAPPPPPAPPDGDTPREVPAVPPAPHEAPPLEPVPEPAAAAPPPPAAADRSPERAEGAPAPDPPPPPPPPPPETKRCAECGRVLAEGEKCPHEAPPPVDAPQVVKVPALPNLGADDPKRERARGGNFNPFDFKQGFARIATGMMHKLCERIVELRPDFADVVPDRKMIDEWYKPCAVETERIIGEEAEKRLKIKPRDMAVIVALGAPAGAAVLVGELEKSAAKHGAAPSNGRPAPGWSEPRPEARGPAVTPETAPPPPAPHQNGAQNVPLGAPAPLEREPDDVSDRYDGSGAA